MTVASFGALARQLTDRSDPDRRGPDRRVRRNSIDENDPAAQPWTHNRFNSAAERIATQEAAIRLAEEMQQEAHAKFTRPRLWEMWGKREALSSQLAGYEAAPPGATPIGAAAAVRKQLAEVEALCAEHEMALTRTDIAIYRTLWARLRKNGEWIADWDTLAAEAGVERKSVGRAFIKLESHGFIKRIRRSRLVKDNEGAFAPQREQIANAFKLMLGTLAGRIRHRFLQLREKRLKRMAAGKARPDGPPRPLMAGALEMRETIAALGASICNAST